MSHHCEQLAVKSGMVEKSCYQLYSAGGEELARGGRRRKNRVMRALAVVLVAALILFGVYEIYLKKLPTTDAGTAPTQAISLRRRSFRRTIRPGSALRQECSS